MVTEKDTLSILDSKSEVCMAKDGKDSKNTNNISIRVHFVGNGEKFKMHKIDQCEGGLQLADIETNNVGVKYLNPMMKYIMVRIEI